MIRLATPKTCAMCCAAPVHAHDEGRYHGDVDMECVVELATKIDAKAAWTAESDRPELMGETIEFAGCAMASLNAALEACKQDPEFAACLTYIAQAAKKARFTEKYAANALNPFDALTEKVMMFSKAGMDAQHGQCSQNMSGTNTPAEVGIITGLSQLQDLR